MEQTKYINLQTEKQFLKLMAADVISRFGDSIDAIAYSWIMYEVTGSESLMAFIIGLNFLPTVLLSPIAGAIIERLPKKNIMIFADLIRMFLVFFVVFLYANKILNPALLIVVTLITSIVESFRIPASGAITPLILKKDMFKLGKSAIYTTSRIAELLGFIIAGSIITWIGSEGALIIDAITFLLSALFIMTIKYKDRFDVQHTKIKVIVADFKEGVKFIAKSNLVKSIGVIGLLINFAVVPLNVFLTPYVVSYMQMGPNALSYLSITLTTGMMMGSFIVPKINKLSNSHITAFSGVLIGITLVGLSIFPYISIEIVKLILILICMFFVGFGGGILNVIIGSTLMANIPLEMMGRISGAVSSMVMISMPIASLICSGLALLFSVLQIFGFFGILLIVSYLLLLVFKKFECLNQGR